MCSPTSVYFLTNLPALPGCSSLSHPTVSSDDYTFPVEECKCLASRSHTRETCVSCWFAEVPFVKVSMGVGRAIVT